MDILNSQFNLGVNVYIKRRERKTGKVLETRFVKNRVTKMMLIGIARYLNGEFNETSPDKIEEYIPRYLAFGTNTAGLSGVNYGVTSTVTVNDAKLLDELKSDSGSNMRIWIGSREFNKISSVSSGPYVRLTINAYVQSNLYDNVVIAEAGLFAKQTGNNCLARVAFDSITKTKNDVLDVTWEITILSVGTTVYASNISIYGSDFLQLGITETGSYVINKTIYDDTDSAVATILDDGSIQTSEGKSTLWSVGLDNDNFYDNGRITGYHIGNDDGTGKRPILEGDRQKLIVNIQPSNVTDSTVMWTSSDESIATVNDDGVVEARGYVSNDDGTYKTCTITGITNNGLKVNCIVEVRPEDEIIAPSGVGFNNVNEYGLTMNIGDKFKIDAVVYPENCTNKTLSFTSSNTSCIIVDNNGNLEAIAAGYAVITCSTSNGRSNSFSVTVSSR